jgi:hypothetical protein
VAARVERDYGDEASSLEAALGNASRILPIVTTTYCPSAANNNYWPELYLNQAIVTENRREPYTDTPAPKVFGNASPLDPQMFERMNDHADALLAGERSGKYSPAEVARWLDELADSSAKSLSDASARTVNRNAPEFRRMAIDISIQAGLGKFFAAKMRAAILYRLYARTGDKQAGEAAITQYVLARKAWAELAERARGVYVSDITVGELPQLRGHWLDRLPAIDQDISDMKQKVEGASTTTANARLANAIGEISAPPNRRISAMTHRPPARFARGETVNIEAVAPGTTAMRLYYRLVDQAVRWESLAMDNRDERFRGSIPGTYTGSAFPLQYYFETRPGEGTPAMYPGFTPQLDNQPYFVCDAALRRPASHQTGRVRQEPPRPLRQ